MYNLKKVLKIKNIILNIIIYYYFKLLLLYYLYTNIKIRVFGGKDITNDNIDVICSTTSLEEL